jgi:hypothetical protein
VLHGLPVWQVPLGRVHVTRAPNGSGSRPGQQSGDAVFAEKLREDRLRDQGLSVVRWTWADLAHFTPVADRLHRRRFDGLAAGQAPALGSFARSP